MSAETLLAALDGVRKTRPGSWMAKCPAHGDKRASLIVTEKDDGRVLMHCFAMQCSVADICSAANVDLAELFPPTDNVRYDGKNKPITRPYITADIFRAVSFEAVVVSLIGTAIKNGEPLSEARYQRLIQATEVLQNAERVANGR